MINIYKPFMLEWLKPVAQQSSSFLLSLSFGHLECIEMRKQLDMIKTRLFHYQPEADVTEFSSIYLELIAYLDNKYLLIVERVYIVDLFFRLVMTLPVEVLLPEKKVDPARATAEWYDILEVAKRSILPEKFPEAEVRLQKIFDTWLFG